VDTGTLTVMYASNSGIRPPINADGSTAWFARLPLPVIFQVFDAHGSTVTTAGTIASFSLVAVDGSPSTGAPVSVGGGGWTVTNGSWLFLLDTSQLASGHSYSYKVTLKDGSLVQFRFSTR
jgi:hypothetical protein